MINTDCKKNAGDDAPFFAPVDVILLEVAGG
jgi:hypothetical protein